MYHAGKQSEAHEYDERSQCIHCGMYKSNVEALSHVCTPAREEMIDRKYREAVNGE
jgi:hypothetical protein